MRVLAVVPGAASDAEPALAALEEALRAAGPGVELERLRDCTEAGLRERLARGDVGIVHVLARGRTNAAARYAVLELDAAGAGARAVNARHLGALLAREPAPALVVLQARASGDDLSGLAPALRGQGVAAVLTAPAMPAARLAAFAGRLYRALAAGRTLEEARAAAQEALAAEPQLAAAVALAAARPEPTPASAQPAAAPPPLAPAAPDAPQPADPRERRERELRAALARKRAGGKFDVFLCHNAADKPAVRSIARALEARGILPWLDERELPPGQPWQPLLEQQIARISSAAVFVGRAGVGPWQEQELYGFLREFVARRAPVIPVLLPDAPAAPELPLFLRAMTYVDFRVGEPDPLARLEWGITGVRPQAD
jgi:hypothetical protein